MSRESRWWFLRKVGRIMASGFHRVEHRLRDQLCSLTFSLGGIYFVGCSYAVGFHSDQFERCIKPASWGLPLLFGVLPLVARFFQSIRRWWDSSLVTHLINASPFFTSDISELIDAILRVLSCSQYGESKGSKHDTTFVLVCFFGTINSLYALLWDLLMDWSVLRPHARFVFLRDELIYSSYIPFYYLSIITNIVIRFMWVIYLPTRGPAAPIRSLIVALFEVLRRCQWNVYRLENEHIGNMDQYRVTREVPLPYSFDEIGYETDVGDEDDRTRTSTQRSARSSKSRSKMRVNT
ncbi:EXS-domain-containing protein [Lactarius psammicola]|nr:EXS-domain-containing protein [Lactarius psammicola]